MATVLAGTPVDAAYLLNHSELFQPVQHLGGALFGDLQLRGNGLSGKGISGRKLLQRSQGSRIELLTDGGEDFPYRHSCGGNGEISAEPGQFILTSSIQQKGLQAHIQQKVRLKKTCAVHASNYRRTGGPE